MNPKNFSSKMLQRKYTSQIINKRKSDGISSSNFINKLSSINNNLIRKIPSQFRYSCQNNNIFSKSKFLKAENKDCKDNNNNNKNEISTKRDKNYYLNLLNEIYLNDSHLPNKNNETGIKVSKKMMKKKTCNFSKLKLFKDNEIIKSSKNLKKLSSKLNIGNKNKSSEKNNENDREKKENSKSKLYNKENPYKRFCSDNCLSEFKPSEALAKVKTKENYKKLRRSKFIMDEGKYINEKLNDPLMNKESKLNKLNKKNKLGNNKRSRNNENKLEYEKVHLENITTSNNLDFKSNTKKKYKKMYKTCFCCLIKNSEDSL